MKIIAVIVLALATAVGASGQTAHVASKQQEPRVATTSGVLFPKEVATVYDMKILVQFEGKLYKLYGTGDSGWTKVADELEVGKDYEAVGVEKGKLVLMVPGTGAKHWKGLVKAKYIIEGISEGAAPAR